MRLYTLRTRAPAEGLMLGGSYTRDIADMPTRTAAMARSAIRGEIVWPDGRVEPLTTHGWLLENITFWTPEKTANTLPAAADGPTVSGSPQPQPATPSTTRQGAAAGERYRR